MRARAVADTDPSAPLPAADSDSDLFPPVAPVVPDVSAPLAAPAAREPSHLLFSGGITDEGVKGKVNQDDFFIWASDDKKSYVMGVFDGHGRELGHFAARKTRESFLASLGNEAALAAIRQNPHSYLNHAFEAAHDAVIKVWVCCAASYQLLGSFSLCCSCSGFHSPFFVFLCFCVLCCSLVPLFLLPISP